MKNTSTVIAACFLLTTACTGYQSSARVAAGAVPPPSLGERFSPEELTRIATGEAVVEEYENFGGSNSSPELLAQLSNDWFAGAKTMPRYTAAATYKAVFDVASDDSTTIRLTAVLENVALMAKAVGSDGKPLYNYAKVLDEAGNPVSYGSLSIDDATLTEEVEERVVAARIPKAMTGEFKLLTRMASFNGTIVSSNYTLTTPAGIAMDAGNLRNYIEFYPYQGKWLVYAATAVNLKIMAGSETPASLVSKLKAVLESYRAAVAR
jgi:hypothetical protein